MEHGYRGKKKLKKTEGEKKVELKRGVERRRKRFKRERDSNNGCCMFHIDVI